MFSFLEIHIRQNLSGQLGALASSSLDDELQHALSSLSMDDRSVSCRPPEETILQEFAAGRL
jgi:hypothetical protein